MNIIKHKRFIRDLILHSNDDNIDIIMNIIDMFEGIEEYNHDIIKIGWYSNNTNHVSIKISSDEYCYLIKFYRNKFQICTINNKSTEWKHVDYIECKLFLRNLVEQSNVLLNSKYEVGVVNG
ncbi:MAG: hypothetical protein MJ126_04495 [Lachnospiraceae bacterium]|nr:hypothetical protein [Lachnospiraceae bacterium]